MVSQADLMPGDVLLYRGWGIAGWLVRMKTWSDVAHTETYLGGGYTARAMVEDGVQTAKLSLDGLMYVLRPRFIPAYLNGLAWHVSCIGQPYDSFGLLRAFFTTGRGNIGKQWCSEHTARFAKKAGYFPFGLFDSEKVSPSMFLTSTAYDIVWRKDPPHASTEEA